MASSRSLLETVMDAWVCIVWSVGMLGFWAFVSGCGLWYVRTYGEHHAAVCLFMHLSTFRKISSCLHCDQKIMSKSNLGKTLQFEKQHMEQQCEKALKHRSLFHQQMARWPERELELIKKNNFWKHGLPSKIESEITFETQILWDPPTPSRSAARYLYVDNLYVFGVCCQ